jgi:hypothetical protein
MDLERGAGNHAPQSSDVLGGTDWHVGEDASLLRHGHDRLEGVRGVGIIPGEAPSGDYAKREALSDGAPVGLRRAADGHEKLQLVGLQVAEESVVPFAAQRV